MHKLQADGGDDVLSAAAAVEEDAAVGPDVRAMVAAAQETHIQEDTTAVFDDLINSLDYDDDDGSDDDHINSDNQKDDEDMISDEQEKDNEDDADEKDEDEEDDADNKEEDEDYVDPQNSEDEEEDEDEASAQLRLKKGGKGAARLGKGSVLDDDDFFAMMAAAVESEEEQSVDSWGEKKAGPSNKQTCGCKRLSGLPPPGPKGSKAAKERKREYDKRRYERMGHGDYNT